MSDGRINTIAKLVARAREVAARGGTPRSRRWVERAEAAWRALALLHRTERCVLNTLGHRRRE